MRLMDLRGLFSRLQGTNYQVGAIVYCVANLLYRWFKTLTFTAILFLINEECLMFWGVFWHLYASDDQIPRRTPDEVMTWAAVGIQLLLIHSPAGGPLSLPRGAISGN